MSLLVLVHGAWHDGSCWDPVVPLLREAGHRTAAPDLPSDDPEAGFEEYAARVADAIGGEPDAIVVGHSLGSDTAALVAAQGAARGVVYLCPRFGGVPFPEGAPPRFTPDAPMPPNDDLGRGTWDPDDAVRRMYRPLPEATARALAARLRPQADLRRRPFPLAAWPAVPSALIAARGDEWFPPASQRWAAELLGARYAELPGGHFPMQERPDALAALLAEIVAGL
ncbi:MAG: alpha/beta fold hydrolase [Thermoleophilia bacterium]